MQPPLILTDADRLTISNSRLHVLERDRRRNAARAKAGWITRKNPSAGGRRQSSGD